MSAESQWDVQKAIYTALSLDATVTNLLANGNNSIVDSVSESEAFPYVVIGEHKAEPFDTQGSYGLNMLITLHIWSEYQGFKEIKNITSAIYDVLHHADFIVQNQNLISCSFISSEVKLKNDGTTRHGIQRFRILTEAV